MLVYGVRCPGYSARVSRNNWSIRCEIAVSKELITKGSLTVIKSKILRRLHLITGHGIRSKLRHGR